MKFNLNSQNGSIFSAVWEYIKRHKKLMIALVVVIVTVALLISAFGGRNSGRQMPGASPATMVLGSMDLEQIVSATGVFKSTMTRELTSSLSYEIIEVYVKEGDSVAKGDILAQLDTTELDAQIATLRKNIVNAEASDAITLAQNERNLANAIDTRDANYNENNAAVDTALTPLNTANEETAAADADKAQKEAELYNAIESGINAAGLPLPADGVIEAITSLTTAQEQLDGGNITQEVYDVIAADAGLPAFFAALENAQTALVAAQTTQATAKAAYDSAVEKRDATYKTNDNSVKAAQDSVDSQKLRDSASSYRSQLEDALENRTKCTIKAPISGKVTAMTAKVGNTAGGSAGAGVSGTSSALFTIEDASSLQISCAVPEYDAVSINAGMSATITSDALDGETWSGRVTSVSQKATDESSNFTVVVKVDPPVGKLAIGMSAKVNIKLSSASNVYAVPYDAVTTDDSGRSVIYVWDESGNQNTGNGEKTDEKAGVRPVVVSTGMETDYYIEITGDELKDGLVILTDPESRNVSTTSTMPGMFRMGG